MQIKTRVDGKCVKEYLKKNVTIFSIFLILGILYGVAYLVVAIIRGNLNSADVEISLILSILIIIISSVFLFRVSKVIKVTNEHAFDAIYDFTDEGIIRETFIEGEKKSESRISYKEIVHYRVSKTYIYLVLFNKSYCPVSKDDKLEEFLISKNIMKK